MPPRSELRPDERAWLQPWPNPFHGSRLVDGAVPVVPGVTLGMLIGLADAEGRHPRPDKPGVIAKDAEPAIRTLRKACLGERMQTPIVGEPPQSLQVDTYGALVLPMLPAIEIAIELARMTRERIAQLAARAERPGVDESGAASSNPAPMEMRSRGSAFGSQASLAAEAARRGGTAVHRALPQLLRTVIE